MWPKLAVGKPGLLINSKYVLFKSIFIVALLKLVNKSVSITPPPCAEGVMPVISYWLFVPPKSKCVIAYLGVEPAPPALSKPYATIDIGAEVSLNVNSP